MMNSKESLVNCTAGSQKHSYLERNQLRSLLSNSLPCYRRPLPLFFMLLFLGFSPLSFAFSLNYDPVWLFNLKSSAHSDSSYDLDESSQLNRQQNLTLELASKLGLGIDVELKNSFPTLFSFYYEVERCGDPSERFSSEKSPSILKHGGSFGITQKIYDRLALRFYLYGEFSSDYIHKLSRKERIVMLPSLIFSWSHSEISEIFYTFENVYDYDDGRFSVKTKRDKGLPKDYSFGFQHLAFFESWNLGVTPYFYFADYLNGQDQGLDYKRTSVGLRTSYEFSPSLMFLGKIERVEHLFSNEFLFAGSHGSYYFEKRRDLISFVECAALWKIFGSLVSGLSWNYLNLESKNFIDVEKKSHSFSFFLIFSDFSLSRLRRIKSLDNFLISDLHALAI